MSSSRTRQAIALAVVAFALLWRVAGDSIGATVLRDRPGCPHSSDLPDPRRLQEARVAVVCLLNQRRAADGLPPLVEDAGLQVAAQAHAEDMGRRKFYAHRDPDGFEPDQRIRQAGFAGSVTGENIHWGVGLNATPGRIVDDWMDSAGHRENILRSSFSRVGTGIGYVAPELGRDGRRVGVYVSDLGG